MQGDSPGGGCGMHLKRLDSWAGDRIFLENEGESKEAITSEIERYMAYPGQALGYKNRTAENPWLRSKQRRN